MDGTLLTKIRRQGTLSVLGGVSYRHSPISLKSLPSTGETLTPKVLLSVSLTVRKFRARVFNRTTVKMVSDNRFVKIINNSKFPPQYLGWRVILLTISEGI